MPTNNERTKRPQSFIDDKMLESDEDTKLSTFNGSPIYEDDIQSIDIDPNKIVTADDVRKARELVSYQEQNKEHSTSAAQTELPAAETEKRLSPAQSKAKTLKEPEKRPDFYATQNNLYQNNFYQPDQRSFTQNNINISYNTKTKTSSEDIVKVNNSKKDQIKAQTTYTNARTRLEKQKEQTALGKAKAANQAAEAAKRKTDALIAKQQAEAESAERKSRAEAESAERISRAEAQAKQADAEAAERKARADAQAKIDVINADKASDLEKKAADDKYAENELRRKEELLVASQKADNEKQKQQRKNERTTGREIRKTDRTSGRETRKTIQKEIDEIYADKNSYLEKRAADIDKINAFADAGIGLIKQLRKSASQASRLRRADIKTNKINLKNENNAFQEKKDIENKALQEKSDIENKAFQEKSDIELAHKAKADALDIKKDDALTANKLKLFAAEKERFAAEKERFAVEKELLELKQKLAQNTNRVLSANVNDNISPTSDTADKDEKPDDTIDPPEQPPKDEDTSDKKPGDDNPPTEKKEKEKPAPQKAPEKDKKSLLGPLGYLLVAFGVIMMLLATVLGPAFAAVGIVSVAGGTAMKVTSFVKTSDREKMDRAIDGHFAEKKSKEKKLRRSKMKEAVKENIKTDGPVVDKIENAARKSREKRNAKWEEVTQNLIDSQTEDVNTLGDEINELIAKLSYEGLSQQNKETLERIKNGEEISDKEIKRLKKLKKELNRINGISEALDKQEEKKSPAEKLAELEENTISPDRRKEDAEDDPEYSDVIPKKTPKTERKTNELTNQIKNFSGDTSSLAAEDKSLLEKVKSGKELSEDEKKRLKKLNKTLSKITVAEEETTNETPVVTDYAPSETEHEEKSSNAYDITPSADQAEAERIAKEREKEIQHLSKNDRIQGYKMFQDSTRQRQMVEALNNGGQSEYAYDLQQAFKSNDNQAVVDILEASGAHKASIIAQSAAESLANKNPKKKSPKQGGRSL